MKTVSLTIDGVEIKARAGETVLWVALDNGLYIPNLCAIREASEPWAGCRLCFVEIEGRERPVTACTEPVADDMVVNTRGAGSLRLARTALELILANHDLDCAHCARNGTCELQRIAKHLGVKLNTQRFGRKVRGLPVDSSSPVFTYDPNKCVLCRRCVWVCRDKLGIGVLGCAQRGFDRVVTTFEGKPIADTNCKGCGDCAEVCPVGSLVLRDEERAKAVYGKHKVAVGARKSDGQKIGVAGRKSDGG